MTSALNIVSRTILANTEPGIPLSDATYSQAALDAFLRLVFGDNIGPARAAQHVYEAVHQLGFTGQLTFGYSNGQVQNTDGEQFTGPYMRVRTARGELHVLPISVDAAALDWIDGIAG